MREIKFRVWDRKLDKMWGPYTLQEMLKDAPSTDMFRERVKDFDFTEFTGLKDKNGVEIYKGDILSHPDDDKFEVKWELSSCAFRAVYSDNEARMLSQQISERGLAVVIGNIHQHPNLLENK